MIKIQKWLSEHGYPNIAQDGIFGNMTRKALYETLGIDDGANAESSHPHFNREEFRCKCGGRYCNGFPSEPTEELYEGLEKLRASLGNVPCNIISGLRCQTWNDLQPGSVPNSYHRLGRAADVQFPGISPAKVLEKAKELHPHYTYICGGSVHVDW